MIQSAALRTNKLLMNVIQNLPAPAENPPFDRPQSPPQTSTASTSRQTTSTTNSFSGAPQMSLTSSEPVVESPTSVAFPRSRGNTTATDMSRATTEIPLPPPNTSNSRGPSRPHSPTSLLSQGASPNFATIQQPLPPAQAPLAEEPDPFDYQVTVNELTVQFLSEFEETRVAALKWLIMLHQKAPKKVGFQCLTLLIVIQRLQILAMDDGTFPALLKTLSDSSEEVSLHGLQHFYAPKLMSSVGHQTRFATPCPNFLKLGRELFPGVHDQPVRALQYRSPTFRDQRKPHHSATVSQSQHGKDLQSFR